jgi:prophage antirepressor-like protein
MSQLINVLEFKGYQLRVFGTNDKPLFATEDVVKILDIKDIKSIKLDNLEKQVIDISTDRENQSISVLTYIGLIATIRKSKKPVSKEFKQWIVEVIYFTQNDKIQRLEKELEVTQSEFDETKTEVERLQQDYKPQVVYHPVDINDFIDDSCVYLIHINGDYFKFGLTTRMCRRVLEHDKNFRKRKCDPKLVNIWRCCTSKIMHLVEMMIKNYLIHNGIKVREFDQTEIIKTDNIQHIVDIITKYVTRYNNLNESTADMRKLELVNEGKRLDLEMRKLEVEKLKLEQSNTDKRLDLERLKLEIVLQKLKIGRSNNDNLANISGDEELNSQTLHPDNLAEYNENEEDDVIIQNTQQKDKRKQDTDEWIKNNLPEQRQITTDYYTKYKNNIKVALPVNQFSQYVRAYGYEIKSSNGYRYWNKLVIS